MTATTHTYPVIEGTYYEVTPGPVAIALTDRVVDGWRVYLIEGDTTWLMAGYIALAPALSWAKYAAESAQAEREAFAHGAAQDAARWHLVAQIALTADARASFLADGDGHAPGDPRWMAFHDALGEEMRMRREYFDAFGTPYDDGQEGQ